MWELVKIRAFHLRFKNIQHSNFWDCIYLEGCECECVLTSNSHLTGYLIRKLAGQLLIDQQVWGVSLINLQDPWKLLFVKNKLKCLTKKIIVLNLSPQTCYLQKVRSPSRVLDDHYNPSFPYNLRSIFAATGNCQEINLHLFVGIVAFVPWFTFARISSPVHLCQGGSHNCRLVPKQSLKCWQLLWRLEHRDGRGRLRFLAPER